MANQWFKFYGAEYLADPKILSLSAEERSCWLTLLCHASAGNGVIKYLTEEILLRQSGVTSVTNSNEGPLQRFEKLEMIAVEGVTITLLNWKKKQDSSLTNAERQRRFREKHSKKKSNGKVTGQSYESNARIDKNRIEHSEANASHLKDKKSMKNYEEPTIDIDSNEPLPTQAEKSREKTERKRAILRGYLRVKLGLPKGTDIAMSPEFKHDYIRFSKQLDSLSDFSDPQIEKSLAYCSEKFGQIDWSPAAVLKHIYTANK